MATATLPVLKELLADPAKYPDATKYRNPDGSEVTLGELRKAGVNSASVAIEAPTSPNAETDKVVEQRLEQKKKQKKHPVEARIGELTAKAAELEKTLKKEREEREAAIAAQQEKNIAAELDRRKAEAAANDKRPVRTEFAEGAPGDTEFAAKMGEWVVRQQEKIKPKVAPAPAPDRAATLTETQTAQAKAEYDHFLEVGTEFIKKNPDFNETLDAAAKRGLTLHNRAQYRIIKRAIPQVAYYLARPENEVEARNLMKMDEFDQELEVVRIAERLAAHPSDFVSSAPPPGRRLNGGGAQTDITSPDQMSPDDYLRWRREQIKSGARRPPHR